MKPDEVHVARARRGAMRCSISARSGPVPPITMCSCGPVAEARRRVEQRVEAVAEEEPAHGERDERVDRADRAGARISAAALAVDRREPLDVGAEVHDRDVAPRREPAAR